MKFVWIRDRDRNSHNDFEFARNGSIAKGSNNHEGALLVGTDCMNKSININISYSRAEAEHLHAPIVAADDDAGVLVHAH